MVGTFCATTILFHDWILLKVFNLKNLWKWVAYYKKLHSFSLGVQ